MIAPLDPRARLTPREAAEYVEFSEKAMRNWRSAGTGPAYIKAHGRISYVVADLDRWLEFHRVSPTRTTPALLRSA
ncbi:DNA-binding protein [Kocuria sp. CCUG 69068]|uniref:helix-turn-helix domain-containing protein n=1 Tax=Kocuria sp. CCUG 69068 TaxID=2043138 RepID=UPI001E4F2918|nr:DNA-binding protein [Kocuria sp. CCUG 69068]